MRITVIGTGYLGAVHAACLADIGHDVLGIDTDAEKIAQLASGRAPFFEPGLGDVLARTVAAGRLRFSCSLAEAAEFGDVHFICVGTPQLPGSHAADLSILNAVIDELALRLRRPCLVVGKSTVPVGTASRLAAVIAERAPAGPAAELAWNPEFLREGFAVQDTINPDRLVVGVESSEAETTLRQVYEPMLQAGVPFIATDLATAELAKVAANAFLATKISFINAIADICDAADADIVALADAMGHDSRIGRSGLSAGLGFGGGCLPKDIRALMARAGELGVAAPLAFLREVDGINQERRTRTVKIAREMAGGSLLGKHVAVFGAAFKPESDDVRDSPALAVAVAVQSEGAVVRVHDPVAMDSARKACPTLDYVPEPAVACEQADVVLHLTEWRHYRDLDPAALHSLVRQPRILDARNALPLERWEAAGWTVRTLGRTVR
jgi:UDPglucose 6-dehydrogenase